jgi:dTDP-4-dehydrorhamnose reductase
MRERLISWYEFVLAIKELENFDCLVSGIPSMNYPTPAKTSSIFSFIG